MRRMLKIAVLTAAWLCWMPGGVFGQEPQDAIPYTIVEERPTFAGGDVDVFTEWVHSQVRYPEIALMNGVHGRVTLSFTVDTDGSVTDVKVLRGVDPSLDNEAVRVISGSPKWTPGRQDGLPVPVLYVFPVIFEYQEIVIETEVVVEEAIPFQLVEVKPSFQGGDANKFSKWVNSRLVYPEIAKENGVQGRVTLQFTIEKDGSVAKVKVLRGVDPSLDKEAVRVVSESPKWKPGKQKGKPVPVTYTFPVIFQLR